MNYYAHARELLDDPYMAAGTAVPDWLSVVNRKVRAGSKTAVTFVNHPDEHVSAVARGIVRHHSDDDWFHRTRAFAELSWQFTAQIRDLLSQDEGFRPSFLGHILVELLLDDFLIQNDGNRLDEYYRTMESVDPQTVNNAVNLMTTRPALGLDRLIPLFAAERFLYDYSDDSKLLFRLNRVMDRVKLPTLPDAICDFFPIARANVASRSTELMSPD